MFLIKFLITANQIKVKYSLLTSSYMQCCNKHVIIYSGARVSEFIRAIRSFISIDLNHNIIKKKLIYFTTKI